MNQEKVNIQSTSTTSCTAALLRPVPPLIPPIPAQHHPPAMSLLLPPGSPRKHRVKQRTALLALLTLLTFTCYLLFIAYPSIDLSKSLLTHVQDHNRRPHVHVESPADQQHTAPLRKVQPALAPRPPLSLSPEEELAALCAFIAALPHNVLPSFVDPDVPLDPQLVLDFDPRSETAQEELHRVVEQVWARFPVILFTKARLPVPISALRLHSSDSREVRHVLSNMNLKPAPLVVGVDQREDADVLSPLLTRLTHVPSLPILLIGGQPVGTDAHDTKDMMNEVRKLHKNGELARRILKAGSTLDSRKKKGKAIKRRSD
ncbi:hypothetical protein J3R82DRAFT_10820 [Butyriboletus roseoflavus]|nr:hypothetical protein J3R82DRAFT_10820 [Butyriboletus roseoflavus]